MRGLVFALVGAALCAGCSTVAISKPGTLAGIDVKGAGGQADRTLCVSNEGYFLFNSLPVFSSSMAWNEKSKGINPSAVSFFKDETALSRVAEVFYRYADRENCDVVDVVVDNRTTYPLGFNLLDLMMRHEICITGVLKPRK